MSQHPETTALLIIDVQRDFCEGGALAVPGGSEVVPVINAMISSFQTVILSQDWHPAGHSSFATSHTDKNPYDMVDMPYGPQVLWPDHCVQGSSGAAFHPDLNTDAAQMIVRKGFRPGIDSYSAFVENDQETPTGLDGYLQSRGITDLVLTGLALDFCVQYSALDARRLGYGAQVAESACRAIDLGGSADAARTAMTDAGVELQNT
jgi:nicotinamidase/pyrazinamidase